MTTTSSTISLNAAKNIRSFDLRRDLKSTADLIELCFNDTLSDDGRRYLRRMREASELGSSAHWAALASLRGSFPLSGYVWEVAGELVGNISMIPFVHQGRRLYLLANVVVHPNFRRRGIARAMTESALKKLRRMRVRDAWLQVRSDNPAAVHLYTSMGFSIQARRTTWKILPNEIQGAVQPGIRITPRFSRHWEQQRQWIDNNYPGNLRWHFYLKAPALKPGLAGWFYRFFLEVDIHHWAAYHNGQFLGVLSWQAAQTRSDHLWLAASPKTENETLRAIMPFIRKERRIYRPLNFDYPAGRAVETLLEAGFKEQHTLLWMHKSLS
ncbi:MAG: N-acetyltransferase [Chloroflexota bacterium]